MITNQGHQPYSLFSQAGRQNSFVFAAPHSGRLYPQDMQDKSPLSKTELRISEDAFVDELFDWVPSEGACLLVATYARAYLDLNRATNELDPAMFTPQLPIDTVNISQRVKSGLGLIPAIVAEGKHIYTAPLPARAAAQRTESIHAPYHTKLRELLDSRIKRTRQAYFIDCHSMPSEEKPLSGFSKQPDIILGDCWGQSCSSQLTTVVEEQLTKNGFKVRRNVPYSGGYATSHYGKPLHHTHALQIEINRAIYMNEDTLEKHPDFNEIKKRLKATFAKVIPAMQAPKRNVNAKLAAE